MNTWSAAGNEKSSVSLQNVSPVDTVNPIRHPWSVWMTHACQFVCKVVSFLLFVDIFIRLLYPFMPKVSSTRLQYGI